MQSGSNRHPVQHAQSAAATTVAQHEQVARAAGVLDDTATRGGCASAQAGALIARACCKSPVFLPRFNLARAQNCPWRSWGRYSPPTRSQLGVRQVLVLVLQRYAVVELGFTRITTGVTVKRAVAGSRAACAIIERGRRMTFQQLMPTQRVVLRPGSDRRLRCVPRTTARRCRRRTHRQR